MVKSLKIKTKLLLSLIILPLLSLVVACNPVAEGEDAEVESISTVDPTSDSSAKNGRIEGFGYLSGALKADNGNSKFAARNASLKVKDHPAYDRKAKADGTFEIMNMPPGIYTILAEYVDGAGDKFSAQYKNIIVSAIGETALPNNIFLERAGSISGTVSLLYNPNNVTIDGIKVYIPGTSYQATTDASGNYQITNVPSGNYDEVKFEKAGLSDGSLSNIIVNVNADTTLENVAMSLSSGPYGEITATSSGEYSAELNAFFTNTQTPVLTLQYNTKAVLMIISNEPTFQDKSWIPVSSQFTIPTGLLSFDNKYQDVYIKFSDLNGLESPAKKFKFFVDTTAPIVNTACLFYCFSEIPSGLENSLPIFSQVTDDNGHIAYFQASTTNDFSSTTWQSIGQVTSSTFGRNLSSSFNGNIADSFDTLGTGDLYFRVKDLAGNISTTKSFSTTLGTKSVYDSFSASNFVQPKSMDIYFDTSFSPYEFKGPFLPGHHTTQTGTTLTQNIHATRFKYVDGIMPLGFNTSIVNADGFYGLAFDESNKLYVVGADKLGISSDQGANYQIRSKYGFSPGFSLKHIQIDSTGVIYVAGLIDSFAVSTNDGKSFKIKEVIDNNSSIRGLYLDNTDNIYIYTTGGLIVSSDKGVTFSQFTTSNGLPSNRINSVFRDNAGNIYAATNLGLGKSTDGGVSFSIKTTANGLPSNNLLYITGDGVSKILIATDNGLAISNDNGESFMTKTSSNGLGSNYLEKVVLDSGGNIYALTGDQEVSVSTNGGVSFINRPWTGVKDIVLDNNDIPYFNFGSRLITSTDYGNSLTNNYNSNGTYNRLEDIAVNSSGEMFVICSSRICKSTNNGRSFTEVPSYFNEYLYDLSIDNFDNIYVYGYSNHFYMSTDGGATFNRIYVNTYGMTQIGDLFVANNGTIFIVGTNGGLLKSSDSGASFTKYDTSNGLPTNQTVAVAADTTGKIFVATQAGLSISTDGGTSFVTKTTLDGLLSNEIRDMQYTNSGKLIIGTNIGVSISTDDGVTFSNNDSLGGVSNPSVTKILIDDSENIIVLFQNIYQGGNGDYSISTDGGDTFSYGNPYLTNLPEIKSMCFAPNNKIYAITSEFSGYRNFILESTNQSFETVP